MPFEHTTPHQLYDPDRPRKTIQSWDEVPTFADECEAVEFFDTHELGDEFWDNAPPISAEERALMDRIRANRRARTEQR